MNNGSHSFTPWNAIRSLIEKGAKVAQVQIMRDCNEHGAFVDSEMTLLMPSGEAVKFRPSEFAAKRAFELLGT